MEISVMYQPTEAITEASMDELRSSALLLDVIADNVADLIAVVDCRGRRIWNNFAYAERLGYLPEELKGSDSMVEVHPDDLPLVRETFRRSMAEGCGRRIEYRMRRKDGSWITLESEGRVARDWNGHERCLVVVARDITSRKEADREKQEHSERQMARAKALADFKGSEHLQEGTLWVCFREATEIAVALTHFQSASVWTLDKAGGVLTRQHRSNADPAQAPEATLTRESAAAFFALLGTDRIIAARHLAADQRLSEIAPTLTAGGAASVLIIPLRRGTAVLGALFCERNDSDHGWDLDEVTFATSLADGLVLAIDAHERLNTYHRLHQSQQHLANELREAAKYVESLLPRPCQGEIEADWRFLPSDALGGDAFGFHWVDPEHLAIYLLDVVGHGVRAALVSVAVINQLRTGSLADADLLDPHHVLTAINDAFQMDEQDGMYFTLWYGIYDKRQRSLHYASAGHPPALLFSPHSAEPRQLHTRGLMIGAFPGAQYESAACEVPPGSDLYVFSDGVYEIERPDGRTATLNDLVALLPCAGRDLDRIVAETRAMHRPGVGGFADDFSILRLTFP